MIALSEVYSCRLSRLIGIACLMLLQEKAITSVRGQHALHTDTAILASSRLIELDEGLNWKFRTASGPITLTSQQVVHWGAWNGVTRNSASWLSDGSWLVGDLQFTSPEALHLVNHTKSDHNMM